MTVIYRKIQSKVQVLFSGAIASCNYPRDQPADFEQSAGKQ